MHRKRWLFISVFLMIELSFFSLWGKDGVSHAKDMAAVLGLYSYTDHPKESKANLEGLMPLLDLINLMIDDNHAPEYYEARSEKYSDWGTVYSDFDPTRYYQFGTNNQAYHKLQDDMSGLDEPVNFSWGEYGHRLMFHWGFERQTEMNSGALRNALFSNVGKEVSQESIDVFIGLIYGIQDERMMEMRDAVDDFFCLGNSRSLSRGIAAILYYVHLLGDHIEHANDKTAEAVLNPNLILKNLRNTYLELIVPQSSDTKSAAKKARRDYEKLLAEMETLRLSQLDSTAYAQKLLELLIQYLPSSMKYWINHSCDSRNYSYW